jgi:hypothetical protein
MKIKRQSTESRVNQLLSKEEPSYGFMELSPMEMTLALNWYSQNREKEVSYKYLAEYCKANTIKARTEQIEQQVSTVGFVCRMISRGAILDAQSLLWLSQKLKKMAAIEVEQKAPPMIPATKPVTIQDRLKEKSNKSIGLLEGAVDEFILTDFKTVPNTLQLMRENEVKGVHGPNIVNFFKKCRDEFRLAIAGTDTQIEEGYSNYTLPQLKKMADLYDQIVSDTLTIMGESVAGKTPRKRKLKTPEKQVRHLKFCLYDEALKINSVPPTRMIGAEGVWVYNRKNRMLSYYVADDASGLGVKGCAFLNYSKIKSRTKKLRKPEEVLSQVLSGGKVVLKNLFESLTTKNAKVTGRMNKETLLVRVTV